MPNPENFEQNDEKEINPEFVGEVENCALHTEGKVNFLLAEGGLKPSSSIGVVLRNGENVFVSDDEVKNIRSLLKKSNLAFFIGEKSSSKTEDGGIFEEVEIIVSKNKNDLEKILEIKSRMPTPQQIEKGDFDKEQNKQDQKDFGSALGYPFTAVEAFTGGSEPLDKNSLPEGIKQSDAYLFCQYQLSKYNWQQELQTSQDWADFIRQTSPKIFEQYKKEKLNN